MGSTVSLPYLAIVVAAITSVSPFHPEAARADTSDTPSLPAPETSWFGRMVPDHQHRVSGDYLMMDSSGDGTLVGTGTGTGYGVSATTIRGNSYFNFAGKARFTYLTGSAQKTIEGEDLTLPFTAYAMEAGLGMHIYLLPGPHKGIRTYIGTSFIIGLSHLRLTDIPEDNSILYSASSGITMGLDTSIGIELQKNLYCELQLRGSSGSLGGFSTLSISGTAFTLGYRW